MKAALLIALFLFLTACGTQAQAAAKPSPTMAEVTSTPGEQPTLPPSPSPTEAAPPAATPSPTSVDLTAASTPTVEPTEGCIDKAAFSEDVTIPDGTLIQMGDSFTKTWRVQNAGTCTWTGYQLAYTGGEAMNGPMSIPMPEIKPGDYGNVSVDLQAPQRGGGAIGYWHFLNAAGQAFGVGSVADGPLWVQINVEYPLPAEGTPEAANTSTSVISNTSSSATSSTSSTVTPTAQTSQGGCVYSLNSDYEVQILSLINNARAQNGAGPLALDDKLNAAALAHSMDMACNGIISHTGTDGSTWYDRVKAQGFANYNSDRENIYVGDPAFGGDAQGAFTWWMNSAIHHKTLMNPDQKLIGISYVYSKNSAYGGNYTTEFARP
jgi:uncharacterized protein YkwD